LLLGEAVQRGADFLVAHGGTHSNFTRLVAACGSKLGIPVVLLVNGRDTRNQGNLLLSGLFKADIRFVLVQSESDLARAALHLMRERRTEGQRGYMLPSAGASALGIVGYRAGIQELTEQLGSMHSEFDAIVVAAGSGGTVAGFLAQMAFDMPSTQLLGISVGPDREKIRSRSAALATGNADPGPLRNFIRDKFEVFDEFSGAHYGTATEASWSATRLAAETEGIVLDPLYTGKAISGLKQLVADRRIASTARVLFWHTGGVPTLFSTANDHEMGHQHLIMEE
jgi:1-aminocyclopropane-1-carboxylate deaminase/D-cysteine desulfhydrase-like pyridoxal-dependent ACC family enzyme